MSTCVTHSFGFVHCIGMFCPIGWEGQIGDLGQEKSAFSDVCRVDLMASSCERKIGIITFLCVTVLIYLIVNLMRVTVRC